MPSSFRSTYKLATLMALIEHSIEHLPTDPDASLTVPIPDLAHRVIRRDRPGSRW